LKKPIAELLEQLEKLKQVAEKSKVDLTRTIGDLEKKIEETRKQIYGNLTAWQKVQLSRHADRPYALSLYPILY
jgi:acetyl-CoA carboxylase carboxyl transferase subunit alpha